MKCFASIELHTVEHQFLDGSLGTMGRSSRDQNNHTIQALELFF